MKKICIITLALIFTGCHHEESEKELTNTKADAPPCSELGTNSGGLQCSIGMHDFDSIDSN